MKPRLGRKVYCLYNNGILIDTVGYLEAGKKIPKEWLDEYNEISDRWEEKE